MSEDHLHGLGPCAACGHDPACGWAQVNDDWLCHTDDHSCYTPDARLALTESPPTS